MGVSIGEIKNIIEDTVSDAMIDVYDEVVKKLCESAEEIIYDAYNPKDYSRRHTFTHENGYSFDSNGPMQFTVKADAEFNPAGNTEANGGNLAELIYYGDESENSGYGWIPPKDREPTYLQPRPWIDDARDRIQSSGVFKNTVAKALRARGFKVL